MVYQLLIAHGISLLVLGLILAAGISVRYAGRRHKGDNSSESRSEQQPSSADRIHWFPATRDENKPTSTARTIFALAIGAGVLFGVNRYFAHYPLPGTSAVLLAPLSVIALRAMVRSGQIRNPGSGERDFGLRAVWADVMRAAVCIIAGFALVVAYKPEEPDSLRLKCPLWCRQCGMGHI